MKFTCDEDHSPWLRGERGRFQYIKDSRGYIVGSIYPEPQGGWSWQSCNNAVHASWSDPSPPEISRSAAIDAAIADYVARKME